MAAFLQQFCTLVQQCGRVSSGNNVLFSDAQITPSGSTFIWGSVCCNGPLYNIWFLTCFKIPNVCGQYRFIGILGILE